MTMVEFSASRVSSASMRRSVVPGSVAGRFLAIGNAKDSGWEAGRQGGRDWCELEIQCGERARPASPADGRGPSLRSGSSTSRRTPEGLYRLLREQGLETGGGANRVHVGVLGGPVLVEG